MIGFIREVKTSTSRELKKNILTTDPDMLKATYVTYHI